MKPVCSLAPSADCPHCPRLATFRAEQRAAHPDWFNAPVPPFGDPGAWLAIIGLAPGLKGANRTGRAFTGDGSGAMLFAVMAEQGLARGAYAGEPCDGLRLDGAIIVNAVRCVPPRNRPTPLEIRACRRYLTGSLAALPALRVILALGRIAHDAALDALGLRRGEYRFAHGAEHRLPEGLMLVDSYHCSRYNQNIGRITHKMLGSAFEIARQYRVAGRNEQSTKNNDPPG
jgi:uracil-DNA glycosylase family 4